MTNPTPDTHWSRREMLRLGALAPLGLGLDRLLSSEARASAPRRRPAKSCLLVFMEGGPSHIDTVDLKPNAPDNVRGEFRPIATRIPGVPVCEHLPGLSRHLHRLALVRSVTHTITDHNAGAYYALTGKYPADGSRLVVSDGPGNHPPFGAVAARLRPTGQPLPDFVHVGEVMSNNNFNLPGQSAGFLGASFDPLVTGDPSLPGFQIPGMSPRPEVTDARLGRRGALLGQVDGALAALADAPALGRMDAHRRRAFEMIASPHVRRAFDLGREPRAVRERYGVDRGHDRSVEARQFGGLPHLGQCMLLARRLIEAGVRLVTVVTGRRIDQAWDTHRDHFPLMRQALLPYFDRAFSALMEDLVVRGLLDETLVVVMGEFGRTPRLGYVTSNAGAAPGGRDHWPFCYSVMLGGAGVPAGLVHGASDRHAAYPSRDPVTPQDVAATVYAALGIDPETEIRDALDRPHALCPGRVIRPLLG